MHTLLQDIRFSARSLAKSWGFTSVAVMMLALGIGATTTAFSIANALLFSPLNGGGSGEGELVRVYSRNRVEGGWRDFSYPNYRDLRANRDLFAELTASTMEKIGVGDGAASHPVYAAFVTSNYFSMLRVPVARGRGFAPADEEPGAPPVVVVSHAFWIGKGGDPDLVGKTLTVGSRVCTVVGIAPEAFTGTLAVIAPAVWLPMSQLDGLSFLASDGSRRRAVLLDRDNHHLSLVGRLAPGVTLASAAPRLEALGRALEQAYPAENGHQALVIGTNSRTDVDKKPSGGPDPFAVTVFFLLAMATVLLLVAALNLANMLLARGGARQREIAIRLAVGAGRWGVVRLILVEASMLSLAGGAVGMWIASGASQLIVSAVGFLFPSIGIVFDPAPDARVLAATLGFCAFGTAVFGLGPALSLSRADVVTALRQQVSTVSGRSRGRRVIRHGLVVAQVALSLALLTAGGLFLFGAARASTADPGFRLEGGLVATIDSSLAGYDEARSRAAFARVLDRVRALPGVVSASVAHTAPYGERNFDRDVQATGAATDSPSVNAQYRVIGADYFRTLGMPILRGREFTRAEEAFATTAHPVVVDAGFAKRMWPNHDPMGQRLQWADQPGGGAPPVSYEVVGVVNSLKVKLFDPAPRAHVYVPAGENFQPAMLVHVRTAPANPAGEAAMKQMVGEAIGAVDPTLPLVAVRTLREHRDAGYEVWFVRLAARVFAVLGLVALVMAGVGLYGVRAFLVGQRTREFGIRVAVGATSGDVMRLVISEGARLVAVGIGVGLLLSAGLSRVLAGWVYGVAAFEPAVFGTTSLLLAVSMLLACYLPARRATVVAPVAALRQE